MKSKNLKSQEFYEMNIRVGGPDYPKDNNLKELIADPVVLK